MQINRHNYEEFFLLYVDNELQQNERTEVENFVMQNIDLAAELEMLKQATLQQEDFSFDQKELLYKTEEGISINNYEEYFVLSVDNELNENKADEVEKFVLKHPELQDEFTLLKQTILQPDFIEFTDKASLYRTEKERRIIPIGWMKLSVAAAILGLIAVTWVFKNNGDAENGRQAVAVISNSPAVIQNKNLPTTVTQTPAEPLEDKVNDQQPAVANAEVQNAVNEKSGAKRIKKETTEEVKKANETRPELMAAADVPKKVLDQSVKTLEPATASIKNITTNNSSKVISDNNDNTEFVAQRKGSEKTTLASNAVYREIDTNEDDNTVYIGGAEINKNKLKGLFKKAAKLLGKKSSESDDDKTLRIAGFEFKSK